MMKPKFAAPKFAAFVLMAIGLSACSRVTPGNVGVKVDQYGSSAGVDKTSLVIAQAPCFQGYHSALI